MCSSDLLVGATPIQNVGAYGQEVSDTVTAVAMMVAGTVGSVFGVRDWEKR